MATPRRGALPVARLIRFLGADGKIHYGEPPTRPGLPARILEGCPFGELKATGHTCQVTRLLPPIAPVNIFCIGLNYMKHYEESAKKRGIALPDYPVIFMKPTTAVCGPEDAVWLPQIEKGEQLDWEVELGVVIGESCRNVKAADALQYVSGYVITNDVSSRHWQKESGAGQWIKGKSFDTFCPVGPMLVSADLIKDPQTLRVVTKVNGEIMQDSNTSDMIFSVAKIIEWLSNNMTLAPGTLIMTGTPAGVATGRSPPNWLKAGDVMELEIDQLGVLRNPIVSPPDMAKL